MHDSTSQIIHHILIYQISDKIQEHTNVLIKSAILVYYEE
jgi:hypothetical protein